MEQHPNRSQTLKSYGSESILLQMFAWFDLLNLPVFAVAMGIVLGIMGICKRHISAGIMIGLGVAFVVLIVIVAFLFYAFTIGGPVPR